MFWKMQCAYALLTVLLVAYSDGQRSERRKSPIQSVPVSADVKKAIDFDCPEEFGYYPHPTDCTQYYVCVFGGALLESCTGGLMYSHELQTCDWPRNVGCTAGGEVVDTPRIQQQPQQQQQHVAPQVSRSSLVQRPTAPAPQPQPQPQSQRIRVQAQPPPPPPRPSPNPVVTSRGQPTHINHQEIVKLNNFQQQLYADVDEQLPPAEEIENDTPQRVLRGQPSSLGAVQRDRDGLSPNTIRQGKVGAFSFGTQIDRDEILQNYSEILTDLTDIIQPSNSIDDIANKENDDIGNKESNDIENKGSDDVEHIRKKRETADDRAFNVESDDREKRQIRYGRVQQGNSYGNQNNVNQRWNEQKKTSDYVQFPTSQFNAGSPFKPSAQIGEGFSPLTGSGINIQNKPSNSQYKTMKTNDNSFKPIVSDSSKQYSNNIPKFSSSTPNYAYFTLNSQDSKSSFPHSTTATPIFKENFQYFSMRPESSITKSPPISSLKSPSQSPFAALSGGFYNNKPETSINYNTKIKNPNHNNFVSKQPVQGSTPQYSYEVGSKRPSQDFFPVSTSSPINDFKPKNQVKPSRLPPVRTSPTNRGKPHLQNSRPSANYESTNNKNTIHRQPKLRPDQYHGHSSTSPKYVDNNSNNNNNDSEDDEEAEEEGDDEEGDEEPEEGEKNKNENQSDDADDIKPDFPEPPGYYVQSVNKYEDIVNPFADPNFDFDSFISKVRNTHLSNVGPKVIENLNSQVRDKPNNQNDHTPKVKSEFLNDHHKYNGMSTPRPFSSSSISWPANTNSQKITPKPTASTSSNDYDDEDEYYDDDDYKFSVTEKNKLRPSRIQYPTKNTLSGGVSSNYKKPSNHQTSNNHKTQYNNNFSNSLSKPPTQYQPFPQSNLYRDEIRRPYTNNTFNQRIPTYQKHVHSSGGNNKIKNNNKYITSTSSKPIFHSSFKITPTLDYESASPQSGNKYALDDSRPTHGNTQTNYNSNKRPLPNDYKTSSKYSENNGYRQPVSTPAPKNRRPIPKPSPEMNDYYYDEDEDDYYYEPPVKSKFMPSTEVKPQRPPIAQNYEEYDDPSSGNDHRKPSSPRRPITNNETFDTDDDNEDSHEYNEAQLKRPVKAKPTYQSTTDHSYSKYPSNSNVQPTKTSILIPVKFDSNNFRPLENKRPAQTPVHHTNQNVIKRPEIANYEVLHSTSNIPIPTKLPSIVHKPRYLNQTTLRPYTVRHRLAKPSSTLSTYSDTYIQNPTKQTILRHPTKVSQNGNYKQPLVVSSTLKTDNENQETRHTDHDDNAPNRVEPVVSSSPSYTRQKGSGGRALYNTTSLQYDQQPYDPYYALYDEDQELYKDSDYAQQYNSASQRPTAQQPFRSTASPSSPSPTPSTQHYTPSQASVYTPQHVSAEDYDDALINPDIDDQNQYQQPVRSSTTSTLDLINELGFGLSTLGGIIRSSISPRVVSTASTTVSTTTTTTYSPPPPVTRAPVVQRSTTSDTFKGNLDPPTERSETLVTKQPVVYNNRYTADSLKSQRLLLQTRRKQLRLLQNSLTPNNSHESQASENVSQFVPHDSKPTQNSESTQRNLEPTPHDSEPIHHNSEPTHHNSEPTHHSSDFIQRELESTQEQLEPTQHISETKLHQSVHDSEATPHVSEQSQYDSEPVQSNMRPTLRRSKAKHVVSTEISTQSPEQHITPTISPLERTSESSVAPEIIPKVSEIVNENPTIASDIPNPPVKTNTSRFLSVSTGFSFRKDNDDNNKEEPSYTLRVYKTPARISILEQTPAPEHNEVSENNPKVSYQIEDLVIENVDSSSSRLNDNNVKVLENVIVSSERPKPITFVVENLPKPGQKPIVIQLKSHTGRSHGPRIGPQDSVIPIYNRPNHRVFNAPTQDTFIYFKPSQQTQKEVYNINNQTIIDTNSNHNKQKVVLKSVIKRTTTTTTTESPVNYNDNQFNSSDNEESDSFVSSKSNLSKEDNIEFVPKDIVSPGNNRRSNNAGTFPNTLLRRKAFRDVFNAKTESSLSNQPNVSPFKTLENLLKDERFDRTTPTNRFQNNIIATTQDPRRTSSRKNAYSPTSHSVDQQFEDSFVSSVGGKSKETLSRRTSPVKRTRTQDVVLLNNPITQNIINNLYKFSSSSAQTSDDDRTSVSIGGFDVSDESVESEEETENKKIYTDQKYAENPTKYNNEKGFQSVNKYAENPIEYDNEKDRVFANKYAESSTENDYETDKSAENPAKYKNEKVALSVEEVENKKVTTDQKYAENPTKYNNEKGFKSVNKYAENPIEYNNGKDRKYVNKYEESSAEYDYENEKSANKYAESSTEYDYEKDKSANKYAENPIEYGREKNIKYVNKYAESTAEYDNVKGNKNVESSIGKFSNKYADSPVNYNNRKTINDKYEKIQQNYETEDPAISAEVDNKSEKPYESRVEAPISLTAYDVDNDEYEEYEDDVPDRTYRIQTSSRPSVGQYDHSSSITNFPRTYPTTTTRPTPSPSRETPPPSTTPETLWTRVTQRNRITVTESPYRSRGGYVNTDKYNSEYSKPSKTFNDVYKEVDDFNNVYDGSRRTTEKERTYTTVLPTAPSLASTTTTPMPTPVKIIPTTVHTTPVPVKSTPASNRASSYRSTSTSSPSIRTSQTSPPSPSTTPSGRTLRINNDIKSKALAGQRSYLPNKCTDNSLQSKCNNDNNLQRTNTRGRGSAHYSTASGGEQSVNTNRGTPAAPNRGRPTLKPSTSIVSKAQEFVDIYRFPPRRPDNVYPTPQVDKTAAKCRKDVCLLPDCSCGGKDIPGDLPVEEVPQLVLLTFDDSVNDLNKGLYSDLFEKDRVNPNGCPILGTFYVSHEWTDYSQVQNLYSGGHEMASHTVSHSFGEQFSQKKWNREVGGQREILAAYGGVKLEDVRGMRAPFLSVGGNKMFKMLYDSNFTYDSSMPVYENRPPSWPYTLDYKLFHDCMIPPCPTKSYPGVWEVPMVMWQDLNGGRCSMGDACSNPPNAEGVYKMLLKNFDRHYTTNRAPFGLFYHAAWFTQPHHKEGFIMFLDTINAMKDVFLVTNWQALQWVRDPTPLSRINSFQPFHCNYQDRPKRCNNPKVCNLWHKSGVRYMRTCQPCPDIYPWTGKTGIRSSRIDNEIEE